MSKFTLDILALGLLLCAVGPLGRAAQCDEEHEFLCPVDNKCIPKTKVCNFVKDCIGGADEMHCGSCEFFMQTPEECGLILKPDRAFTWFRRGMLQEEYRDSVYYSASEPMYYIETNLNTTMKQYIHRYRNKINVIYKPKIIFPHLRPTNNGQCHAVIEMRVTQLGTQVVDSELGDATWPDVSLLIVEPREHMASTAWLPVGRENRKYTTVDLNVKKESASKRGQWLTYKLPLGAHHTVWTLELVVEAAIKSSLVQLSSISYLDCEPLDNKELEEETTDVPLDNICSPNQFRCELSGLCIDKSFICDFGYDCGDNDDSDEAQCDDYLGRCDFEDASLCDWMLSDNETWRYISAQDEDQAFYGSLPRPKFDHTYQSVTKGGHYLLLNSTQIRRFTVYRLQGPHVSLQPGASECSFRFWAGTPTSLSSSQVSTPYMHVARAYIPAEQLFSEGRLYWHRHEVPLLDRSNIEESNIFALQITFGNFGADLENFLNAGGYLALDDFSFSPGCHLVYHGSVLEEVCGENEFFCRTPTPWTNAHCIPLQYYCDFKNDCGEEDPLGLTADEHDCQHECSFEEKQFCLGVDILDGLTKRLNGIYKADDTVNEAFNWSRTNGELLIVSQSAKFLDNQLLGVRQDGSPQQPSKAVSYAPPKATKSMRNLEIHLPTFSECHANCSLELTYKWASHTSNVHASIYMDSEAQSFGYPLLLKRLIPNDLSKSTLQTIKLGIGHQRHPFTILVDVYFSDNLMGLIPYEGALSIYSYRFTECSFYPGLVEARREVEFESLDEDSDDDSMDAMDYLDYQYAPASKVNATCDEGFFQCHAPITCIPEELVCDMQRDCQGGADELDCAAGGKRRWLQYDFDQAKDNELHGMVPGWGGEPDAELTWWPTDGALTRYRNQCGAGPPYDHTRSDYTGTYLITTGKGAGVGLTANLYSPQFILDAQCERVVFYLYFWGEHMNKFQVLKRTRRTDTLLYEIRGGEKENPLIDRWQRVSLSLNENPLAKSEEEQEFHLIFRGFSGLGPSDLIALDDVSFGPLCKLAANSSSRLPTPPETDRQQAEAASLKPEEEEEGKRASSWVKIGVVVAVLATLVMVSVGYQSRNLLSLATASASRDPPSDNHNLTASGCMMELSLENLGTDRGDQESTEGSHETLQHHQV